MNVASGKRIPMRHPPVEAVLFEVCLLASSRTNLPRNRYKPEEIVAKLLQVDVRIGPLWRTAIQQIGVSEVTFYRWRQEFGGLKINRAKQLKNLALENSRLRKAASEFTLDKLILVEPASRALTTLAQSPVFH
jgi:putative transposase